MQTSVTHDQTMVLIPCYLDSPSLSLLIPEIRSLYPDITILVVNDTAMPDEELTQLASEHDFDAIDAPYNMGHQGAILFGLRVTLIQSKYSHIKHIITMDADGQDDPSAITDMLSLTEDRYIAVAQRAGKRPEGIKFSVLYGLYKIGFRLLAGFNPDYGNYAVLPRLVAKQVALSPDYDSIYSMALHHSATIKKHPLPRRERFQGHSRLKLNGLVDHALSVLLPNLKAVAMRMFILTALLTTLLVTFATAIIAAKIFLPPEYVAPNWATVICFGSAMLCFQLMTLSILLFVLAAANRQSASSSRIMAMLAYIQAQEHLDSKGEFVNIMKAIN